jgi:hypothetical protein
MGSLAFMVAPPSVNCEPAHFVMERKMMLTIKRLVEEQR